MKNELPCGGIDRRSGANNKPCDQHHPDADLDVTLGEGSEHGVEDVARGEHDGAHKAHQSDGLETVDDDPEEGGADHLGRGVSSHHQPILNQVDARLQLSSESESIEKMKMNIALPKRCKDTFRCRSESFRIPRGTWRRAPRTQSEAWPSSPPGSPGSSPGRRPASLPNCPRSWTPASLQR